MNTTPRGNRLHVAIFGRRNAGKSSVINALTGQDAALVSPIKGTTTDPVYKTMELLPLGPVTLIDTAGLDDDGELGQLRVTKTRDVLNKTDLAMVVIDATEEASQYDVDIIGVAKEKGVSVIAVSNKNDLTNLTPQQVTAMEQELQVPVVAISATSGLNIDQLKKAIIKNAPQEPIPQLIADLVSPGDIVVLVAPIDSGAPKGRIILPQQQTLREVLDNNATAIVLQPQELKQTLDSLNTKPSLVITDSQAFDQVAQVVPEDIPLTSFSILFARSKGNLEQLIQGTKALRNLEDGDKVLIAEACTHHQQKNDIGRVKIPRWLDQITGKDLQLHHTNGNQFPDNLSEYKLVIHCGACMLTRRAVLHRLEVVKEHGVPVVNYGIFISYVQGVIDRSLTPFPQTLETWRDISG